MLRTPFSAESRRCEPEQPNEVAPLMAHLYARPVPPPTPVDPAKAPPAAVLPGVYAVDRYLERDVCKISLGVAMLDASGRYEARLLDGCHDTGLGIFGAVAW